MNTFDYFGVWESCCVSILVLSDELKSIIEVLNGRISILFASEVRDRPLEDHHIIKIELAFSVYLDSSEESIFYKSHKPVKTVELCLKLWLAIAHYY